MNVLVAVSIKGIGTPSKSAGIGCSDTEEEEVVEEEECALSSSESSASLDFAAIRMVEEDDDGDELIQEGEEEKDGYGIFLDMDPQPPTLMSKGGACFRCGCCCGTIIQADTPVVIHHHQYTINARIIIMSLSKFRNNLCGEKVNSF